MHEPPPVANTRPRSPRWLPLVAVIGTSLAVVGFVRGIREPATGPVRPQPRVPVSSDAAPAAVKYAEMPEAALSPNAQWRPSLSDLRYFKPGIFDPVERTEDMKQAALADRARNRAYDGAPPTIPHPAGNMAAAACLACHGEGLKVGDRIASRISHAHLSNCTQCHVEQTTSNDAQNDFVGLYRAGPGQRANPGAPPTIPHHTWMRTDCLSCHGLITRPGTRTTHPWLTNCLQCHAASGNGDYSRAQP